MSVDSLKLSSEEKDRCRNEGLCLYCRGKGHVVVDCLLRVKFLSVTLCVH